MVLSLPVVVNGMAVTDINSIFGKFVVVVDVTVTVFGSNGLCIVCGLTIPVKKKGLKIITIVSRNTYTQLLTIFTQCLRYAYMDLE